MTQRVINSYLLDAFEMALRNDEKSRNTIEKYIRDVLHFARFAKNRPIEKALTLEYKATLGETYALSSANSMLAALNAFLRFANWDDCCVRQFKVQREAYCSETKELTEKEYRALVNAAGRNQNNRLLLLIQTICSTGIRVSELPYITVEAAKRGEAVVYGKGKSRRVFLISRLCAQLLRYAGQRGIKSGMIFVTKSGKPLNRSNVWREMKALCVQAGVSANKVFPHNLRHLFARTFYRMEKDLAKLADVLGHVNINTTRIYIVSTGAEHKRCLETMRLIL